jgi:hypothetical protein
MKPSKLPGSGWDELNQEKRPNRVFFEPMRRSTLASNWSLSKGRGAMRT